MGIKISELPSGPAVQTAVAPATNAEGTETSKVTLMGIASLATKQTVGLGNVDNTSDANKPVSTATQTALNGKASSVHAHSSNDISDATTAGRSFLTAIDSAAQNILLWESLPVQTSGSITAKKGGHYINKAQDLIPMGGSFAILDPSDPSEGDYYVVWDHGGYFFQLGGKTYGGGQLAAGKIIVRVYRSFFMGGGAWQTQMLNDSVVQKNSLSSDITNESISKILITEDNNRVYRWNGTSYTEINYALASHAHNDLYYTESETDTLLNQKAPLASPTFTGTVNGITSSMVGLGNVDNTSDANKPVSTATQTALNGKASSSHNHDRLTNNNKEIILGSNGSLTFPDGAVQTSAGITDSSQDGITYARKDGNWINVASSASLQVSRGTEAQRIAVVPLEGEPVYTTDSKRLYVGDGVTLGGVDILAQTNLASPTAIITGSPIRPLSPVNVILPSSKVLMPDGTYVSCSGKWISIPPTWDSNNYSMNQQAWPPYRNKDVEESRIIGFESDVEGIIGGCFNSVSTNSVFLSLNLSSLKFVWGDFGINTYGSDSLSTLNSLNLSNLTMVAGKFTLTNNNLTSLSLPALKIVNSTMTLASTSIASLSLPELTYVNSFSINFGLLTSLSLNSLKGFGSFTLTLPLLTSLSISSLQSNDGVLSLSSASLSTLTLPEPGVWKSCAGINITTGSLDQTTVDILLDRLAYMDGTNNTSSFVASCRISGGTNAAPSNLGSVTTNGSNFVCSGTTCTVSLAGHGYSSGDVLRISGVTTATNANRYAVITATNANQFTYVITSQTATGAGTATIIKAGASVKTLVTRGVTLTTN